MGRTTLQGIDIELSVLEAKRIVEGDPRMIEALRESLQGHLSHAGVEFVGFDNKKEETQRRIPDSLLVECDFCGEEFKKRGMKMHLRTCPEYEERVA
jgi:hypothetical protein